MTQQLQQKRLVVVAEEGRLRRETAKYYSRITQIWVHQNRAGTLPVEE